MSKQVFVHEFNQQSEAIEWIKLKSNGTVIIPLQPLFIDGVPNILPLQYFFMKEPKDNYRYSMNYTKPALGMRLQN